MTPRHRSTRRAPLLIGTGVVVVVAIAIGLTVTHNTLGDFCDAREALSDVVERGVRGHPRGAIGMALDLKSGYSRMAEAAPKKIADAAAVVSDHNEILADAVIEADGDMFLVAARLPPGLLGEDLRAAEIAVEAFVMESCARD